MNGPAVRKENGQGNGAPCPSTCLTLDRSGQGDDDRPREAWRARLARPGGLEGLWTLNSTEIHVEIRRLA